MGRSAFLKIYPRTHVSASSCTSGLIWPPAPEIFKSVKWRDLIGHFWDHALRCAERPTNLAGMMLQKWPRALNFLVLKMADEMAVEREKVGDSSTNRLANYQRCARELLRSALLEQHGGALTTTQRAPKTAELRRWALIRVCIGSF